MPETQQVQKREEGAQIIYQAPGIDERLKSESLMVLRITPAEATLSEGLVLLLEDGKAVEYTIAQILAKNVTGENSDQASKIRKAMDKDFLGAYDSVLSLLREEQGKKLLININGGPNKISPDDRVRSHLSLREQLEDGKVKPNSGVPILDLVLEKVNDGGFRYRI